MLDIWDVDEWKEASAVFGAKRSNPDIIKIDGLVDQYHKTKGREIEKRVDLLDKIVETGVKFVGEKLDEKKFMNPQAYKRVPAVQQLILQATAKMKYLEEILDVEKTFPYLLGVAPPSKAPKEGWQADWQKRIDKVNAQLSTLHNFKQWVGAEVGGKILDESYWTEAIDPLHRNFQNTNQAALFNLWNKLRYDDKYPCKISFHRWLEEQLPELVDRIKSTKYQDEIGREQYRVWARAVGELWRQENGVWSKFDTQERSTNFHGSGWAIFVIGAEDQEMYSHDHIDLKGFYHACFLSGRPVIGAGEVQVRNGELKKMSPKSGHYKPGVKEILATIEWFKSKNVDLDEFEVSLPLNTKPDAKTDKEAELHPKNQHWYAASYFLQKKGNVNYKDCTFVASPTAKLKGAQVRITHLASKDYVLIFDGAKWQLDFEIEKEPWLQKARGK